MEAVSSRDPSEDESSEREDAEAHVSHRSGESSDAEGSGCGIGSAPAGSDRDDEEVDASDGSDWTHVSTGSRCASAVHACPGAAQSVGCHSPEPSRAMVTEMDGENMSPDAITTGECAMALPSMG
jgi:hypothetical protein